MAVVDEAMVSRGHDRVADTNDPTAHAVIVALRDAARELGTARLSDATIFSTLEPCPMCVGALIAMDVAALVYAVPNTREGAAGTVVQLAQHAALRRRMTVVSGIRRDEAEELFARPATQRRRHLTADPPRSAPVVALGGHSLDCPAERCPSG